MAKKKAASNPKRDAILKLFKTSHIDLTAAKEHAEDIEQLSEALGPESHGLFSDVPRVLLCCQFLLYRQVDIFDEMPDEVALAIGTLIGGCVAELKRVIASAGQGE